MSRLRSIARVAVGAALVLAAASAPAAEPTAGAGPATGSIEELGQTYLREGGAPAEIEADWRAWADRTGSSVWERPGLTRAQRSLITIAMMSVLREEGPLRVHVEAGLTNGLTRDEISETILHTAVYAGIPQALRSMRICREVFDRLDAEAAAPE